METEPFIEELNKQTNNEYKFMLKSAILDRSADFCVIEILYRDGIILTKELKQELEKIIKSILPQTFKYEINFVKNFISEERVSKEFSDFMEKSFPSISFKQKSIELQGYTFKISFDVDSLSYEHARQKNLDYEVQKYLKAKFEDFDFKCEYFENKVYVQDEKQLLKQKFTEEEPDMSAIRKIEISEPEIFVGEEISELPAYIKDKTTPENEVVLCGKVKQIKDIVIKRKPKQKKEEQTNESLSESSNEGKQEEKKEDKTQNSELNTSNENITETSDNNDIETEEDKTAKYERKLFKWTLEDFTGQIGCVFFSNKENQPKLMQLEADNQIVVRGKLEEDKYGGGNVVVVKDISLCKLPEKFEEKIIYKEERPFYEWVEPEKFVTYKQDDLMSFMEEKKVPEMLKDKTFVCYDFETTGLHYESGDKIIEIGAVKIENGKITQRFVSFIDPEKPIPAESTKISGITDSDVKGAPKDYQVLQDFFKFTRGATIIGYNNINFDNVFLIGQGKKCRWNFSSNETDDVYRYAQKYVFGVKNYKLGTIAEALGVVLDNAHSAFFDALATAEVFIKIAEKIDNQ
jgi:DNA polymerase III epsilon subunit family exonuclease